MARRERKRTLLRTEENVLDVVSGLYEAAVDPGLWPDALSGIRGIMNGSLASIVAGWDQHGNKPLVLFDRGNKELVGELGTQAHKLVVEDLCPRYRFAVDNPNLPIVYDYLHGDETGFRTDPAYDLYRQYDCDYYIAAPRLLDLPGSETFLLLERDRSAGHVERSDIRLFALLSAYVRRAVRLSYVLEFRTLDSDMASLACEQQTHGVLVLDSVGKVVLANRAVRSMCALRDGLVLTAEGVELQRRSDHRKLQTLIANAVAIAGGRLAPGGGAMLVPRPSGKRPYQLSVVPMPKWQTLWASHPPAATVIVADPEAAPELPPDLLKRLYGLSPREAELAIEMASGASLDVCAERLGITKGTAKLYLHNIFRKTETHRQAELVALLLRVPGRSSGGAPPA